VTNDSNSCGTVTTTPRKNGKDRQHWSELIFNCSARESRSIAMIEPRWMDSWGLQIQLPIAASSPRKSSVSASKIILG
jgi:hypothetical protein